MDKKGRRKGKRGKGGQEKYRKIQKNMGKNQRQHKKRNQKRSDYKQGNQQGRFWAKLFTFPKC